MISLISLPVRYGLVGIHISPNFIIQNFISDIETCRGGVLPPVFQQIQIFVCLRWRRGDPLIPLITAPVRYGQAGGRTPPLRGDYRISIIGHCICSPNFIIQNFISDIETCRGGVLPPVFQQIQIFVYFRWRRFNCFISIIDHRSCSGREDPAPTG